MSGLSIEPRLVAVTGVASGEVFTLSGPQFTFGRDPENTICVPDPALSRKHCVFTCETGGWVVRDLDSSNGTFVNGVQVATHALADGDRIAVGGSMLLFVEANAQPAGADTADGDEVAPTTRLAMDEASYLKSHPQAGASRVEHGLRALVTISTVIHALRSEEELYRELLTLLRAFVPVAGIAVLLRRPDGDVQVAAAGSSGSEPVEVSTGIVTRVMAEREGVLTRDVTSSRTFQADAGSLAGVRSLMCVPIAAREAAVGAIYLVASDRAAFDDEHLQLVTAIARIAAIAIENVRHVAALERETQRLQADLQLHHNLVGDSDAMRRVYERIARVARSEATVLLTGETGTGKELAARAIHLNSARGRRPFVAINCAALTETLLESELFGHERGAFTGAVSQKKGRLELADGGTLFLDEVGELASALQSKLLRVLQEREFERVGGTRPIRVDLRVISATNRSLLEDVRVRRFREDLYFRLNVVAIEMPPLRERRGDIPALALHFLGRFTRKAGRRLTGISPAALKCLNAYDWPGNVRELENAIERGVALGVTEEILPEDLPEAVVEAALGPAAAEGDSFHAAVLESKRRAVIQAFRSAGGSYTEAARLLGVHPNYLHRLVRNLGLRAALSGKP